MLKRYLVFSGQEHYQETDKRPYIGGWNEFRGSYSTFEDAVTQAKKRFRPSWNFHEELNPYWIQVVDTQKNKAWFGGDVYGTWCGSWRDYL